MVVLREPDDELVGDESLVARHELRLGVQLTLEPSRDLHRLHITLERPRERAAHRSFDLLLEALENAHVTSFGWVRKNLRSYPAETAGLADQRVARGSGLGPLPDPAPVWEGGFAQRTGAGGRSSIRWLLGPFARTSAQTAGSSRFRGRYAHKFQTARVQPLSWPFATHRSQTARRVERASPPWSAGAEVVAIVLAFPAGSDGVTRMNRARRVGRNGRRAGFRCQCPQGRGGSNPPSRPVSAATLHHRVGGCCRLSRMLRSSRYSCCPTTRFSVLPLPSIQARTSTTRMAEMWSETPAASRSFQQVVVRAPRYRPATRGEAAPSRNVEPLTRFFLMTESKIGISRGGSRRRPHFGADHAGLRSRACAGEVTGAVDYTSTRSRSGPTDSKTGRRSAPAADSGNTTADRPYTSTESSDTAMTSSAVKTLADAALVDKGSNPSKIAPVNPMISSTAA